MLTPGVVGAGGGAFRGGLLCTSQCELLHLQNSRRAEPRRQRGWWQHPSTWRQHPHACFCARQTETSRATLCQAQSWPPQALWHYIRMISASAYVSIRLHTSAYVRATLCQAQSWLLKPCGIILEWFLRLHSSAFVCIRQHTSEQRFVKHSRDLLKPCGIILEWFLRLHSSAYVSIRLRTSAYVSIRQHTSAYVSIRQQTSGATLCQEPGAWELWRTLNCSACMQTYVAVSWRMLSYVRSHARSFSDA